MNGTLNKKIIVVDKDKLKDIIYDNYSKEIIEQLLNDINNKYNIEINEYDFDITSCKPIINIKGKFKNFKIEGQIIFDVSYKEKTLILKINEIKIKGLGLLNNLFKNSKNQEFNLEINDETINEIEAIEKEDKILYLIVK